MYKFICSFVCFLTQLLGCLFIFLFTCLLCSQFSYLVIQSPICLFILISQLNHPSVCLPTFSLTYILVCLLASLLFQVVVLFPCFLSIYLLAFLLPSKLLYHSLTNYLLICSRPFLCTCLFSL